MLKRLAICVVFITIMFTACTPATETRKPSGPPSLIAVDNGNPPFMYELNRKAAETLINEFQNSQ
jgi:hypothetical protein